MQFTTIVQGWPLKNLIIFLRQELIMVYLIYAFWDLKRGIV